MTKKFLTFGILAIVLVGVFIAPLKVLAVECSAMTQSGPCTRAGENCTITIAPFGDMGDFQKSINCGGKVEIKNSADQNIEETDSPLANAIAGAAAKWIGAFLMVISGAILTFVGMLFDWAVQFTIVDMAKNIGDPAGVGGAITVAWATLRDIANMCFIFVLLFAAFRTMFDSNFGNFGTTIKNIIIVALLINFSLFFSKVVIDASNIVSLGFYKSITSANTTTVGATSDGTISKGYMRLLGLQTWHDSNVLQAKEGMTPQTILLVGIMSSIFMLVTAVILLISGIMFVTRFIILVFLMVLSPLAFIAYIVPGQNKHFSGWWESLKNQSFFAPLFFALTWVVFKIASAPGFLGRLTQVGGAKPTFIGALETPSTFFAIVFNYVLVLGFAVTALVISKKMASAGATGKAFGAITGGIGTGVIGGTAWAGRNTIGRGSKALAESGGLRNAASSGKWYSGAAKAGLWSANKTSKASFDVRASDTIGKVPGLGDEMKILGKAGGKGGFAKAVDDKAKAKAQYAKDVYGQTDWEKEEFERRKKEEEAGVKAKRATTEASAKREAEEAEKKRKEHMNNDEKIKEHSDTLADLNADKKAKQIKLKEAKSAGKTAEAEELNKELGSIASRIANEREARKEREKEIEDTDTRYRELKEVADEKKEAAKEAKSKLKKKEIDDDELSKETQKLKNKGKERQEAYADRVEGVLELAGNKQAARKIREQAKGKSNKDKAADLLKAMKEDEDKASGTASAAPASAAPAAPPPAASPSP